MTYFSGLSITLCFTSSCRPPYQVGVQLFQVGCEPGAREALRELDDGIAEMVRDIVT
jgi:hypothetical protein